MSVLETDPCPSPVDERSGLGTGGQGPVIAAEDRITYAEAQEIVGYSKVHLWRLVRDGELNREGSGQKGDRNVRLSRTEVEALALRRYRRAGRPITG